MEIEPADTEVDYSIIRDPIFTSVRSLDDYLHVMEIGTPEIKHIISKECDVILECKVCQSLFRSLPNFLSHKRVYCKRKFAGYLPSVASHVTEDETVVLEPTDPDNDSENKDAKTGDVRPIYKSVLDGTFKGKSVDYKVYTDALLKEQTLAADRETTIVTLDNIPGNKNARYQTVETFHGDVSDTELSQIKTRKRKATRDSKQREKIVKVEPKAASHSHVKFSLRNRKNTDSETDKPKGQQRSVCTEWKKLCNLKTITCKKCNQKYSCLKTLRFHIENIHQERRRFYPCPICPSLFSQIWGTRRHVEHHHKKSYEYWRSVNEQVKSQSFFIAVKDLDEAGRPRNYGKPMAKKSAAARFKQRAVANLKKKAAASKKTRIKKVESSSDDEEDQTPLKSLSAKLKKQREITADAAAAKKKTSPPVNKEKEGTVFKPTPGKTLKVKMSPVKSDKDAAKPTPTKQQPQNNDDGATISASGQKVYKCYNCHSTYDLKGSLNKHINRGRCFKKGKKCSRFVRPSDDGSSKARVSEKSPEKLNKEKRELLASVLSPKQLRKVNSLMDRNNIKCLQCNKQFTALILLSRHVIRHLGIVRYQCKFCLYKSFNQGECMKHVRNSHKKENAHKFVLNIDQEDATKVDCSSRGLSKDNYKYQRVPEDSQSKVTQPRSPGTSGASSGAENAGTPTFNLNVAKRLFGTAAAGKPGNAAELVPVMVKSEPVDPEDRRHSSDASTNGSDQNAKNYNISTRNSPRMFDTKPYQRGQNAKSVTTRHKDDDKSENAAPRKHSDDGQKGKSDGYTEIKNVNNKTPPKDRKAAEQLKKDKDSSTEKLIAEIFG